MIASVAHSQTIYQDGTTVTANGITFQVGLDKYIFALSNMANVYDNQANWHYKDGRELETEDEYAVIDGSMKPGGQERAIRETFGDAFIASMRASYPTFDSSPLTIFYVVGPEGDTLEVAFTMHPVPELLSLAPEVYAKLEQNLKKYVKWELNQYAKELEFMHGLSFVHFTQVPLDSELHHLKPGLTDDLDPAGELME